MTQVLDVASGYDPGKQAVTQVLVFARTSTPSLETRVLMYDEHTVQFAERSSSSRVLPLESSTDKGAVGGVKPLRG